MSKFDDFCNAVMTSQTRYNQYESECHAFGSRLVDRIRTYYEIPQGNLQYHPLDKEVKVGMTYFFNGAIHLSEDGYWHLGVRLVLSKDKDWINLNPPAVLLRLLFKREDSIFLLKLGEALHVKEFRIESQTDESFVPFLDHLAQQIEESYTTGLERFLNKNVSRRIGF